MQPSLSMPFPLTVDLLLWDAGRHLVTTLLNKSSSDGGSSAWSATPSRAANGAFYLYAIIKNRPNQEVTKKLFRTAVFNFIFGYTRVSFRPF